MLRKRIFDVGSWFQNKIISMTKDHLYKQIKDETLRRKLESKDVFGCKRPLMLDNYYPTFTKENVQLVTDSVTGLTENAIVSKNAETGEDTERNADVLIWGTGKLSKYIWTIQRINTDIHVNGLPGYNPVDFGLPVPTRGRTGQLLSDKYQPELFSLYGIPPSLDVFLYG